MSFLNQNPEQSEQKDQDQANSKPNFSLVINWLRQVFVYSIVTLVSVAIVVTIVLDLPFSLYVNVPIQTNHATDRVLNNALGLTARSQLIPEPIASNNRENFVTAAVKKVGPAVVRIDTERTIATQAPDIFSDDPLFRRFFGKDFFPERPQMPREFRQHGQGSGIVIKPDGTILTNAHVIDGADDVEVKLRDGRTFRGKVLGLDVVTDIAVVKIDGTDLPVAPIGSAENLQVGDWAIALGNPLGLDNTVTLGIISTLSRPSNQVGIADKRIDFIQTDAAINPGNSGGPLLNQNGEVIGINTAIRPDAQGIGFAIPIDKAVAIETKLAQGKTISHPYIGVSMVTVTPDLIADLERDPNAPRIEPGTEGVFVTRVMRDSPAAIAGLKLGDVITRIKGQKVTNTGQVQKLVENSRVNQPLRIVVKRGSSNLTLTVKPQELQTANLR
ncbi:HtrA2 peptidase [Thalassoporum mexicanum PCC 7367]|uniref:HhoA/HhoB/HtrA family serine endopeptidase n=1 Tax=Thalassoporum mexicanum TaxID=3457544 RepID=UPI00029FA102|nr:HhoA/HhoB/HtrA family serine endopeptidase [Pseudanabaena sp. PCC 7367]AFY70426.1 HtrA2 peptidase [Pseudanabaena sp. PCC 7367]